MSEKAPVVYHGTSMPDPDWWQTLWSDPAGVVAKLGLKPGMVALDLGCGDGWFTKPIAQIAQRVYALDAVPALVQATEQRVASIGHVQCIVGDAMDASRYVPEPLDYILLANTLHGAPDRAALVQSCAALLKTGGYLAIVGWHVRPREECQVLGKPRGPHPDLRMSAEETIKVVQACGFVHISSESVSLYHYGLVFEYQPVPRR